MAFVMDVKDETTGRKFLLVALPTKADRRVAIALECFEDSRRAFSMDEIDAAYALRDHINSLSDSNPQNKNKKKK